MPDPVRIRSNLYTHCVKSCSGTISFLGMPSWGVAQPPHALALMASVARDSGFSVTVYDLNIDFYHLVESSERRFWGVEESDKWAEPGMPGELWLKYESWLLPSLERIYARKTPDLVALSVTFSSRYFSLWAGLHLKSLRPDIPVLFGGVDCFPAEYGSRFLDSSEPPACDIICQGEGEIAFRCFLEEFSRTSSYRTSVPGFVYRDTSGLINTGKADLPALGERQPLPAFDLFDLSKYTSPGSLPFFLSRGCMNACTFCSEKPNYGRFRSRKAEEAFAEVQALLAYADPTRGSLELKLSDSMFNANPKELERFADLLIEHRTPLRWGGQAFIGSPMSKELLQKLKRAGLVSVFWGLESGSQHVVDLMRKRFQQQDARHKLEMLSELGIEQHIAIIIGYPGETPEDFLDTIDLILEYGQKPLCRINEPGLLVVRPNSPLFEHFEEYGLRNNDYYKWETKDGSNTLALRLGRRFIAQQAYANLSLSMSFLVDRTEISYVDLNEGVVQSDLFTVLKGLYERSGSSEQFEKAVSSWAEESLTVKDGLSPLPRAWNRLDKNSPLGRAKLFRLILEGLKLRKETFSPKGQPKCDTLPPMG